MTAPFDTIYLSATEALSRFRERSLSPVELLDAQIARAAAVEPAVNALCYTDYDNARAAARDAERVWFHQPDQARPLEGISIGVKNEHGRAGWPLTSGTSWMQGPPETAHVPLVQRLLDAGGITHAQTNVPELCLAHFVRTARYGITRNPWNLDFTCGGSSGGSAAALATGTATLASGSDLAGSIRMPASWCGVVGLKPSYGRVPESSFLFANVTGNHNGPMARTVADCALMFNIMNGPHSIDPATVAPAITVPLQQRSVSGMRIALSVDLGYFSVAPDIEANTRAVAQALRDQGAIVEEVPGPFDRRVRDAFMDYLCHNCIGPMRPHLMPHYEVLTDYVRAFIDFADTRTVQDYYATWDTTEAMHHALRGILDRYDALICPTMANHLCPPEGQADGHLHLLDHAMTYPFNLLSRHPVLSVPSGLDQQGVPSGVQIVGQRFDDAAVFRIGAAVEQATRFPERFARGGLAV